MGNRKFAGKKDIIVLVVVLCVGLILLFALNSGEKGIYAEVLKENTVVKRVDLAKDATFSLEECPNVVFRVENGAIAFEKSDCPDKVCVRTGFIKKIGQSAVCLPNRLTLRIVGQSDSVDAIEG